MGRRRKKSLTGNFFTSLWVLFKSAVVSLASASWVVIVFLAKGVASLTILLAGRVQQKKSVIVAERKKKVSLKLFPPRFSSFSVSSTVSGEFSVFEDRLLNDSLIITVAGRRGSGKSTLGFRILENVHAKKKRPCFVLGVKQSVIPAWIQSVDDIELVSNDGVVLVDEGAVSFSSRSSMSKKNKKLGDLLAIARHKNLSLILITQNTGMLDKNVLNLTDVLLFKKGSLLQSQMERSAVKKLYEKAGKSFAKLDKKDELSFCYVFDSDFEGMIKTSLPSFWSENISKNKA